MKHKYIHLVLAAGQAMHIAVDQHRVIAAHPTQDLARTLFDDQAEWGLKHTWQQTGQHTGEASFTLSTLGLIGEERDRTVVLAISDDRGEGFVHDDL